METDSNYGQNNYSGIFINKRSEALFQARCWLTLNCDSTFQYTSSSCLNRQSSEGKWNVVDNKIYLFTSKKIIRFINKKRKKKNSLFHTYKNLTGAVLIPHDSTLVWAFENEVPDTLDRQKQTPNR
jgi:hypothetical protein